MARPRKNRLNDAPKEEIEANFLVLDPDVPEKDEIVIAKHIPKMERIMFLNGRDPGFPLEFHYESKTHPLKHYTLYHGLETDLPEEVIDHLENCGENYYGYRRGLDGQPQMFVKGQKFIFQCKRVRAA